MSTEKIVSDAVEQVQAETAEQLAEAQEQLAARQAEAEQLATDIAAAAIEGERGKLIENLQKELKECRSEIRNLTQQVSSLIVRQQEILAQANSRPAPISEPTPKPQADPPPSPESKAPIVEPEKELPKPDASADPTKRERKPAKWF